MNITPIEAEWIKERVEKIDFLNFLFPQQVLQLIEHIHPRIVPGTQAVIQEGEKGQAFFLIYNGRMSVHVKKNEKKTKLAILNRGDYFGEISLLTGKPTTAAIIANAPSKVFFLDGKIFIKMIRENKKFSEHIEMVMDNRLKKRREALEALGYGELGDVNQAIKDFLKQTGQPSESDKEGS